MPKSTLSCGSIELALGYNSSTGKLLPTGPIAIINRDVGLNSLVIFFRDNNINLPRSNIENVFDSVHSDFVSESNQYILPIPGVVDFIKTLKANNINLSLITSDTLDGARSSLDKLEILNCFDFLAGKDSGFGHKVSGLPAIEACKFFAVSPKNTIIIGDAPMDYMMGLQSGINSILISTGQIEKKDLLSLTPFVCDNVSELRLQF